MKYCASHTLPVLVALLALAALGPGCAGPSSDGCRFEPERCGGGRAGAFCVDDSDCRGFCCTDAANCAGGMCSYACDIDEDCPVDMACQHNLCFYACEFDEDCAVGQTCEHDGVCEWP